MQQALLACGIAYPATYIAANDVVAARIYRGYSRTDQAISELSATEAPSKDFLAAMLPVFVLQVIGFGVGVRQVADENRPLRVTGNLLIAQGLAFPLWRFFPMTSREEMVEGTVATNDVGHLALTVVSILVIFGQMGVSAAALDTRFRRFSLAMAAVILASGGLTGAMSSDIAKGGATRGMGIVERTSYGSWLLWMAVLAVVLLRRSREPAKTRLVVRTPS